MTIKVWITISFIIAISLTIIWQSDPDQPDPEFLATDAYFSVGGVPITLPFVAVEKISTPLGSANPIPRFSNDTRRFETREYKTTFLELASNSDLPMQVAALSVFYGVYHSYGEHLDSLPICHLLTREWARLICKNKRTGMQVHIPRRFTLVDRQYLPTFRERSLPAGITANQVARLKLNTGHPEVICASKSRSCNGVVAITNELLVFWNVEHSRSEAQIEKISKQGGALFQLVLNGLGHTEKKFEDILQD